MPTYFTSATFSYLRELAANNQREWFADNKPSFEEQLRQPYLRLIADLATPLRKISTHYRADARPQGGSLFRIHRDTRFSADKSPYKTYAGARFFHECAPQIAAPSFYLHIQPNQCFVAAGLWHPEPATVKRIRDFIVDNPASWKKAVHNQRFQQRFETGGDSLTKAPRGFDPNHELISDLKRKDFVAWETFNDQQACTADFQSFAIDAFKALAPLVDYLCAALELDF